MEKKKKKIADLKNGSEYCLTFNCSFALKDILLKSHLASFLCLKGKRFFFFLAVSLVDSHWHLNEEHEFALCKISIN